MGHAGRPDTAGDSKKVQPTIAQNSAHLDTQAQKDTDAQVARKRFAFEEIFFIQLERQRAKRAYQQNPTFTVNILKNDIDDFLKRFPFSATGAQSRAIDTIVSDLKKTSL